MSKRAAWIFFAIAMVILLATTIILWLDCTPNCRQLYLG